MSIAIGRAAYQSKRWYAALHVSRQSGLCVAADSKMGRGILVNKKMMIAFLPCRAGSQRVPHKNTRPFAGSADGLVGIKLDQLLECPVIDQIVLSSNDPEVLAIADKRQAAAGARLSIDHRPDHLCSSATSTDEVIDYVPKVIDQGDVLWTHVTSPFFGADDYSASIIAYRDALAACAHDSLMGVTQLHTFLWDQTGPLNYDKTIERWPRTQTLRPVFEVNSAIFIAPIEIYRRLGDRVGDRPLLYAIGKEKTVDIDWLEDFKLAERLWQLR